jgi:hypothetical protein
MISGWHSLGKWLLEPFSSRIGQRLGRVVQLITHRLIKTCDTEHESQSDE